MGLVDFRNPRHSGRRSRLLALTALLTAVAATAWAGLPTDELRGAIDHVIAILNDPTLKSPARATARYAAIRAAIEPVFDFPETARRALGVHWSQRTDEERKEFIRLFTELLERSYISKIEAYGGDRIRYLGEAIDGDDATVRTEILTPREAEIPVDYLMLRRDGRWLVYDVLIEGVSLVQDYRSQFNTIIDTSSYAELVKKIEARLDELRAK